MISKIKILLIISITSLILGSILLVIGINYGVSLKGRFVERLLFFVFILSTLTGLIYSLKNRNKKTTSTFVVTLITPILISMISVRFSLIGMFHIVLFSIISLLSNESPFVENEEYKVCQSYSLSTDSAYHITKKETLTDREISHFQTHIDLKTAKFLFSKDSLIITNKNERLSVGLKQ
jgi:hypothetical protein